MGLCDEVRTHAAGVVDEARFVRIDRDRLAAVPPGPPPQLDPERHYLEGSRADVAHYILALDAINFGSGWFPTLAKRPGCSGYFTVSSALADHYRERGPWSPSELRALDGPTVAAIFGQAPDHRLMWLFADALNDLGRFMEGRTALDVIGAAQGSAETLAAQLTAGMESFADPGFHKRAQIAAADLALAGVAEFSDLDQLTIFADNLVPHVLRVDGVLVYHRDLADRIDRGELLPRGPEEVEIRAAAVHACTLLRDLTGVPEHTLDNWLWNRGQEPRYKAVPRHRTRTTAY